MYAGDTHSSKNLPLLYLIQHDSEETQLLVNTLKSSHQVQHFPDWSSFNLVRNTTVPAALLLDSEMAEWKQDSAALMKAIMQQFPHTPVLLLLNHDDIAERLAANRAGVSRNILKPIDNKKLARILDEVTRPMPLQAYRALMIGDDTITLADHAKTLSSSGLDVYSLNQPLQVLEAIQSFKPEVLVLATEMSGVSATELLGLLREDDELALLPALCLSSESDTELQTITASTLWASLQSSLVKSSELAVAAIAQARTYRETYENRAAFNRSGYETELEHLALDYHAIVSKADAKGNIIYVNDRFCEISGYEREELIGKNHRLIKSDRHSPEFYRELWRDISSGKIWKGRICNHRKNGQEYWVESTIVSSLDEHGKPYQYVSIRTEITSLKSLEIEAQKSSERLQRSQVFANIGTWDWDIQSGDLYWSERIAPLFGYSDSKLETTYENFLAAVHPDDRNKVINAVNSCVEKGEDYDIEHRVIWPNGKIRWVQEKGDVTRSKDGAPLHMLGVVIDIHDRKIIEEALKDSEKRLKEAQRIGRIGSWGLDVKSGELLWSDEIYHIFGRKPGEFKPSYERFFETVHPDDVSLVKASETKAETTGLHDVDHRIILPDGTVRWVHEEARIEYDKAGVKQRLVGIVQDISERKNAERELKESQERNSLLLESVGDGIYGLDVNGKATFANPAACEMLGYKADELLGKDIHELIHHSYPDGSAYPHEDCPMHMSINSGLIQKVDDEVFWCKGGEVISVEYSSTPVRKDGKIVGSVVTFRDIGERLQATQAIVLAKEDAEFASHAKTEFLLSMSHELRTPMNAVLGFAQLLEYDGALGEEQQDSVHEILKAGYHLLDLINEVLDLSKIESGHIDLSLEPVQLTALVSECYSLTAPMAAQQGIELIHCDMDDHIVHADQTRLKQVLLNLLSNSVKYNREQGKVWLEVHPVSETELRITVSDTGYGIAPEKLEELFQSFNRLDAEASEIEGTGIGLAITRRLVEMMNGRIGVDSEPGTGSNFWIELPKKSLQHPEVSDVSDEKLIDNSAVVQEHKSTMLYIEDNPANLKLVSQMLDKQQHIKLITASDAETGIQLASSHRPELILLDINMPQMDGYQVLDILRSDKDLKDVPVIAITVNAMPRDIERGRKAGFNAYLTKPLDVTSFLELIDNHLTDQRPSEKQKNSTRQSDDD